MTVLDEAHYQHNTISHFTHWIVTTPIKAIHCGGECCELMHDMLDETIVYQALQQNKPEPSPHIPTLWHTNEPLENILWDAFHLPLTLDSNSSNDLPVVVYLSSAANKRVSELQSLISRFDY